MRKVEKRVVSVSTDVENRFCNICGKELTDIFDLQESLGFHHTLGYGSKYDSATIDFDMCCACFDSLMDKLIPLCRINPISYNSDNKETMQDVS